MQNPEYIDLIERCIDANNLQETLQMISSVCWEKASHVLSNWQDKELAGRWEKAAKAVESLSVKSSIIAKS